LRRSTESIESTQLGVRVTDSSSMHNRVWISLVGIGVATRVIVGCGEPPLDDLTRPLPGSDAGGTVAVPSGIRAKGGGAGTKSTGGGAPVASVPRGGMPAAPAGEAGDGGEAIAEPPPSSMGGSGGRAGAATGGRLASGGKASTGGAAANTGGAAPTGGATEISGGSDGSGGASSGGGATPLPETGGTSTGGQGTGGGAQGTGGGAPEPPSRAIWFTEYVEGASGTRKALEISTLEETTLLGCRVDVYSNGSPTPSKSGGAVLDASISPGSPWVLCTQEIVDTGAVCSEKVGLNFNGDDAITLVCENQIVDSIGTVGEVRNPKYWGTPELKTADTTLRRVCSVTEGDPIADDAFDPAVEWEAVTPDAFDGLGSHCREP
jgi:hypothetical protein